MFEDGVDVALFVIEILGVVSFATSGAITAIRKKTDILGILVLTLIEIFGGGLLRDIIINQGVPHIFYDLEFHILALVGIVVATFWFLLAYNSKTAKFVEKHRRDLWIDVLDAVGMAVFCITGCQIANAVSLPSETTVAGKVVFVSAMGVISGCGGGMFRDVFIGEIPFVFRKKFYMTPCIISCVIYAIMAVNNVNGIASLIVGILLIVLLRIFATIFKWNLPQAKGYNSLVEQEEKKFE